MATFILFVLAGLLSVPSMKLGGEAKREPSKMYGIWAECQGRNDTLRSRQSIAELFDRVSLARLNALFLHVYRGNRCWYRSGMGDSSPYDKFYKTEKADPLSLAVQMAQKRGIELHAWINVFRIWDNRNAMVVRRVGRGAVTRDSKGRSLLDYKRDDLPDKGYWLDPGDQDVRKYLIGVIGELIENYPGLDGVHLDYVRYPHTEGSAVDFGFGDASTAAFKKKYSMDPFRLSSEKRGLWDEWRRDQITEFIREARKITSKRGKKLSAAVVPDFKKAMTVTFQDWPRWVREGYIDFVVPMNYSADAELVRKRTGEILGLVNEREKVVVGLGAYKVLGSPRDLLEQIKSCMRQGAGGVVLFSYDNMCQKPELFSFLGSHAL